MSKNDQHWMDILKHNKGFDTPDNWLEYAKSHNFQKVKSEKILSCPDCRNDVLKTMGQYIYYSNLITLKRCKKCDLYFSDSHIDPAVIAQHFESTYKYDSSSKNQRNFVFDYIVFLADKYTPHFGEVLDIGGGQGYLLDHLRKQRPDIRPTLNDLSEKSCAYSSKYFGIESICVAIPELQQLETKFDTIVLVDVIYYEPNICKAWRVISDLLKPSGTVIIRVPNKLLMIRLNQILFEIFNSKNKRRLQDSIRFFNSEYIYIFSKSYFKKRMVRLGFNKISILPSPLPMKQRKIYDGIARMYFQASNLVNKISFGKLIATPSFIVVAQK